MVFLSPPPVAKWTHTCSISALTSSIRTPRTLRRYQQIGNRPRSTSRRPTEHPTGFIQSYLLGKLYTFLLIYILFLSLDITTFSTYRTFQPSYTEEYKNITVRFLRCHRGPRGGWFKTPAAAWRQLERGCQLRSQREAEPSLSRPDCLTHRLN